MSRRLARRTRGASSILASVFVVVVACGGRSGLVEGSLESSASNTIAETLAGGSAGNRSRSSFGGAFGHQGGANATGGVLGIGGFVHVGGVSGIGGFAQVGGVSGSHLGGTGSLNPAQGGSRAPNSTATLGTGTGTDTVCYAGVQCGTGDRATCVDTNTDPFNCGLCGHVCSKGAACVGGICQLLTCNVDFSLGGLPLLETGSGLRSLAVADFNRDGKPDIASANQTDNTVSVLLGRGNGTFLPRRDYPAGNTPDSIAAGDMDGDGNCDLATANYASNDVTVFLGRGDGSFEFADNFETGRTPAAIVMSDFNGDRTLDVATANYEDGTMSVLLGLGDAELGSKRDYQVGTSPNSLASGDLDRDGNQDVVVVNHHSSSVSTFMGTGDGSFLDRRDTSLGYIYPRSVAIADFNGDEKPDLGVGDPSGRGYNGELIMLLGAGDGSFPSNAIYAYSTSAVTAADFNGDNQADLLALDYGSRGVLLRGTKDGTLPQDVGFWSAMGGDVLASGDFNGDHQRDIATGVSGWVNLQLGNGDGTFRLPQALPESPNPTKIVVSDLNRDHIQDLIVANRDASNLSVILGKGQGTFGEVTDYPIGGYARSVAVGDLDGDGAPEIVSASDSNAVDILFNQGNGSFSNAIRARHGAGFVKLTDFNNDGKLDLLTAVSSPGVLGLALGNGDGTFAALVEYFGASVDYTSPILADDITGDGRPDLIFVNAQGNSLNFLAAAGDGTFSRLGELSMHPGAIGTGDLNEDGLIDLVTNERNANVATVWLGAGDGSFKAIESYPTTYVHFPTELHLADLNGDGHLDLVVPQEIDPALVVFLGNGNGTLGCRVSFDARTAGLALGDLNGDGRTDVVTSANTKGVSVLFNWPF